MNREILFRGKRCSDGKWVYGFYVESKYSWQGHKPHKSWIVSDAISNGGFFNILGRYAVKDDTVGEFTGMRDMHGRKIFEGDIMRTNGCEGFFEVIYDAPDFYLKKNSSGYRFLNHPEKFEVIGNINDNIELLAAK